MARHRGRGSQSQRAEALRGGREDVARRVRRDACLHENPAGALAPNQDEQRDRAHQPRNQKEDEGRRALPGRQLGPHAGDGEAEVHGGARVGQEEVPGHIEAGGDGRAEGKGGSQKRTGPRTAKSICERVLTVPGLRARSIRARQSYGNTTILPSAKGTESMAASVPKRQIRGIVS